MTERAQVLLVTIVLLLIVAVDFVQRIHVPRTLALREAQIETVPLPAEPMTLASAQERLQSWFPAVASQPGGGSAEPANGSGEPGGAAPDRVELGGWRFVLRGIFDTEPPFAVFDVVSSNGGETQQHRLSAGEAINSVSLERISARGVTLSDGERKIQLTLFIDQENETPNATDIDE